MRHTAFTSQLGGGGTSRVLPPPSIDSHVATLTFVCTRLPGHHNTEHPYLVSPAFHPLHIPPLYLTAAGDASQADPNAAESPEPNRCLADCPGLQLPGRFTWAFDVEDSQWENPWVADDLLARG